MSYLFAINGAVITSCFRLRPNLVTWRATTSEIRAALKFGARRGNTRGVATALPTGLIAAGHLLI